MSSFSSSRRKLHDKSVLSPLRKGGHPAMTGMLPSYISNQGDNISCQPPGKKSDYTTRCRALYQNQLWQQPILSTSLLLCTLHQLLSFPGLQFLACIVHFQNAVVCFITSQPLCNSFKEFPLIILSTSPPALSCHSRLPTSILRSNQNLSAVHFLLTWPFPIQGSLNVLSGRRGSNMGLICSQRKYW